MRPTADVPTSAPTAIETTAQNTSAGSNLAQRLRQKFAKANALGSRARCSINVLHTRNPEIAKNRSTPVHGVTKSNNL